MEILIPLGLFAILASWIAAFIQYNKVNRLNEGFKTLAKCLGVCLLIFFLGIGIGYLNMGTGTYGGLIVLVFGLVALGIGAFITLLWGIVAYQNAKQIIDKTPPSSEDILDDFIS